MSGNNQGPNQQQQVNPANPPAIMLDQDPNVNQQLLVIKDRITQDGFLQLTNEQSIIAIEYLTHNGRISQAKMDKLGLRKIGELPSPMRALSEDQLHPIVYEGYNPFKMVVNIQKNYNGNNIPSIQMHDINGNVSTQKPTLPDIIYMCLQAYHIGGACSRKVIGRIRDVEPGVAACLEGIGVSDMRVGKSKNLSMTDLPTLPRIESAFCKHSLFTSVALKKMEFSLLTPGKDASTSDGACLGYTASFVNSGPVYTQALTARQNFSKILNSAKNASNSGMTPAEAMKMQYDGCLFADKDRFRDLIIGTPGVTFSEQEVNIMNLLANTRNNNRMTELECRNILRGLFNVPAALE